MYCYKKHVFDMYLYNLGEYDCTKSGCDRDFYSSNSDYGIYWQQPIDSSATKNIDECRLRCTEDENCGSFEWTNNYCGWWKVGKCLRDSEMTLEDSHFWTCRKQIGTYNQIPFIHQFLVTCLEKSLLKNRF